MESTTPEFSSDVSPQLLAVKSEADVRPITEKSVFQWKIWSVIVASGLLFGAGLTISGMADPSKVINFLKMGPDAGWDPSLGLVMGGAVFVTGLVFPYVLEWRKPVLEKKFSLPTKTQIDARLIIGACLFGIGWGLAGICPGPGIVSVAHGAPSGAVFLATMIVGMLAHDKFVPE